RPSHTRRTLQALERAEGAADSELFIFADGAKDTANISKVNEVRAILGEPWRFKNITIIEREKNWGLAANVIDGVTEVIDQHKKAIILEDDVLLAPYALDYFNAALTKYQDNEKVMHIGAYMYNIDRSNIPETFFTRLTMSQAWATWKQSWGYFEKDIDKLINQFDNRKVENFTFDNTMNFWKQMKLQQKGLINSWAVRWYASVFLKEGLALQTTYSLLDNIGHDGTGVHSSISDMFNTEIQQTKVLYFPDEITENPHA